MLQLYAVTCISVNVACSIVIVNVACSIVIIWTQQYKVYSTSFLFPFSHELSSYLGHLESHIKPVLTHLNLTNVLTR